tara:strand:- start:3559 stop:4218 length:660 start_codon:yes stop_codon:yes gene_type:complete
MSIIYNSYNTKIIPERIIEAEQLLKEIPAKHCFITGSFLYQEKFKDIDVFIISRSKKKFKLSNKKANIIIIDFNDLNSLFFHSLVQTCVSKNLLPKNDLKVTISDYWNVVNETVPTIINQKSFKKEIRNLILYTEFFKKRIVLDSFQLNKKIKEFKSPKQIFGYIEENIPQTISKSRKSSYLKRFFYTQSGVYKELRDYSAQNFLYLLSRKITQCLANG